VINVKIRVLQYTDIIKKKKKVKRILQHVTSIGLFAYFFFFDKEGLAGLIEYTKNHRTVEGKRSLGDCAVQCLCSDESCPERVAQDYVQLGFEFSKARDSTVSLGNLLLCLTNLTVRNVFPVLKWNFLCFSLHPLPLVLSIYNTGRARLSLLHSFTVLISWEKCESFPDYQHFVC